jgi:hypothetical protein
MAGLAARRNRGEYVRWWMQCYFNKEYAEFWITTVAAQGWPCFWNPGAGADVATRAASCTCNSPPEFADSREPLDHLARWLLARSGAAEAFTSGIGTARPFPSTFFRAFSRVT